MTTSRLATGLALALLAAWAPAAGAEHNGRGEPDAAPFPSAAPPVESPGPLDLDIKLRVDGDRFMLNGSFLGLTGLYRAWLNGQRRPDGFSLNGRVEEPGRAPWSFRFEAEVPGWPAR
jgi:hypothetical protein